MRIAGRYKKRDGTVDNLLGGPDFQSVDTGAVRGSLRFKPSDRITVDIIGNYQKDTPTGTAFKSLRFRPTDPVTGEVLGGLGIRDGAALAPGAGFEGGKPLGLDRKVWGVSRLAQGRAQRVPHAQLDHRLPPVPCARDSRRRRHVAAGDHRAPMTRAPNSSARSYV